MIQIGKYTLSQYDDDPEKIWIETDGGEGGQFPADAVEAVIAAFYKENF